jgi:myo-inositol-1(or 4)-monophosphatase
MDHILQTAITAAKIGGDILKSVRIADLAIEEKEGSHASIVTSADIHSQTAIVKHISEAYPDHAIVGEEGSSRKEKSSNIWFIDPLDGTTNYSHALPLYCVSIAFCDKDGPAVGVIFDPVHNQLFHAVRGGGAFFNGERINVSTTRHLRQALVTTQVQSNSARMLDRFAARARIFAEQTRAVRFLGTPALSLAFVACGYFDAFCEPDINPWDVVAGTLLIEEAGGRVTTFGGEMRPHDSCRSILASNGSLHGELVNLLADEAEQAGETLAKAI